jgi:hypothetical protein
MSRNVNRTAVVRCYRTIACATILALGAFGCGHAQHSTATLVPAFGTVTIDGAPLPEAMVQFIPTGATPGQGGSALTDAEGTYKAMTTFGEPGLPAGEYKVIISKRDNPNGGAAIAGPEAESLPAAYSDKKKTTLKASIPTSGEASNNFVLRSVKRPGRG